MRETPTVRTARYLKDDPLLPRLYLWGGQVPEGWEWGNPARGIVQLRRRLGVSQRDLAARAGVSQGHVQRIEAGGDFRYSTLARLLRALGLEMMLAVRPEVPEP